ncbi:MAG: SPASM domain-containing protein [Spirochaetia bacterium]|nr:SPASM domain-containing protein [Spirochaetia bacterium]
MHYSKYTFHASLSGNGASSAGLVIGNYLTGSMDIMDKKESELFLHYQESGSWENYPGITDLLHRRYIFEHEQEERELINEKRQLFLTEYANTPVQIIFTPTYVCNMGCSYCYQADYENTSATLKKDVVDSFFDYINKTFAREKVKPYITLFGGEPLLGGNEYKTSLLYFLHKAKEFEYEIAMVTNGYELENYLPCFIENKFNIKEIQVTLDGIEEIHDKRRPMKTKAGSFDNVTRGINKALQNGFRINLRSIIDKDNMAELYKLAEYAQDRGWLNYPSARFQTTLGRNYELHFCQAGTPLYERSEMWKDFAGEAEKHPVLYKYHSPQFHGMHNLSRTGELPLPVFDGCPAGKKEWAFDFKGDIYGCTASVGVEKYRLGNFISGDRINEEQVNEWKTRDVFSIPECSQCAVSLSCGGGCGVLAANKTGKILSPDCRPVKDLIVTGLRYYNIQTKELSATGGNI